MIVTSHEIPRAHHPGRRRTPGGRSESKLLPDQARIIAAAQEQITIRKDQLRSLPEDNLKRAMLEAQIQTFLEGIRRVQWAYNLPVDID